jgi:hypothetical protein
MTNSVKLPKQSKNKYGKTENVFRLRKGLTHLARVQCGTKNLLELELRVRKQRLNQLHKLITKSPEVQLSHQIFNTKE